MAGFAADKVEGKTLVELQLWISVDFVPPPLQQKRNGKEKGGEMEKEGKE